MRIGILDILSLPARHVFDGLYHRLIARQFASITPQAISVWCRRRGHRTFYATYYGVGDAQRLLPSDLDVVFIASYTQASPLAYALARLFRRAGALTVIGGPHAKAFPTDCLRFFDLVVKECDQCLIDDILAGRFDPGSVVTSARPFEDVPTVEERMPEIRASTFFPRGPRALSTVPMLASTGCPYACDFCVDWRNAYRALPLERLAADLRYLSRSLSETICMFHDPNFAVNFEQVFATLESLPPHERPPYMMESSLSVLRPDRIARLKETNCVLVAPGVESWTDYSNKAGVGRQGGIAKVERVVEHFRRLADHVPYVQGNLCSVWTPTAQMPPSSSRSSSWTARRSCGRHSTSPCPSAARRCTATSSAMAILEAMPFGFYYAPYLVTTLKNYDPVSYYEKLVELFAHVASPSLLVRRLRSTRHRLIKVVHLSRTAGGRTLVNRCREILRLLQSDPQFRAFHEGRSAALPEVYHHIYERTLKDYAGLLSRADRVPVLERAS